MSPTDLYSHKHTCFIGGPHKLELKQLEIDLRAAFFFIPIYSDKNRPFHSTHRKKMTSSREELCGNASISKSMGRSETIAFTTDIPHREIIRAASRYCLPSNNSINLRCTCFALVNPSRPSRDGPRILSRLPCIFKTILISSIKVHNYSLQLDRTRAHRSNATSQRQTFVPKAFHICTARPPKQH